MRTIALFRLLFVPAALFAIACDDSTSPFEPLDADEATPPAHEEAAFDEAAPLVAGSRWADGYLMTETSKTGTTGPNPIYSYNRSGGPITVTKMATGRYVVRFGGLSALVGTKNTVHVTSFGVDGAYCKPVGARLAGDTVEVRCFAGGTGTATNSVFTLLVAGNRDDRAFAYAHQPTTTDYSPSAAGSWNSFGTSRVLRDGVGLYRVVFNGLGARLSATVGGSLQVNAVGTGKAYCKAIDGWGGSPNLTVNVGCFTSAGVPVDAKFSALFVMPAPLMGYAWADQPISASYRAYSVYSWSPAGGGVLITRQGTGVYGVQWDQPPFTGYGTVQVTAWGEGSAQCKLSVLGGRSAVVRCFAGNGVPMDSYYTVLIHS
jgi:hypothetical protein